MSIDVTDKIDMDVTDDNFAEWVLNSSIPVLVDFWANWCGPCNTLTPIIAELKKELKGEVEVFKMDIDANPHTPSSWGIRSIPTLMLFKDGKPIATKLGFLPKSSILEWINSGILNHTP